MLDRHEFVACTHDTITLPLRTTTSRLMFFVVPSGILLIHQSDEYLYAYFLIYNQNILQATVIVFLPPTSIDRFVAHFVAVRISISPKVLQEVPFDQ